MKKLIKKLSLLMSIICIICFCLGCGNDGKAENREDDKINSSQEEDTSDDGDETVPTRAGAMYAEVQPVIDGEIDDCWANTSKLYTDGNYVKGSKQSHGYVSVMWDENNLYFLGVVDDVDITEKDCIAFWISETYHTSAISSDNGVNSTVLPYSSNLSDGMYFSIVNPYGTQFVYTDGEGEPVNDFDTRVIGYECKTSQFDGDTKGYIVEMKIPKQSDAVYTEGHFMGFDVSIDTYFSNKEKRDSYCNWSGIGQYWNYASDLGRLPLLK